MNIPVARAVPTMTDSRKNSIFVVTVLGEVPEESAEGRDEHDDGDGDHGGGGGSASSRWISWSTESSKRAIRCQRVVPPGRDGRCMREAPRRRLGDDDAVG